ncbi:putative transcription factor interactor and regulator LIM family [Helianthus annuus]|uniref:Putative zein-binding domain-containing protein n=1 Tax=Helianthus annuus TaxID=4232 RepID=A0A251RUP1_HELAN|nr:myosin-binding protein 2 [Helianthus annuus]KAF5778633.1 putative transcription factor interactor and regulator LIM family [Helianthus annuus]KAJ0494062.1 putative transcription factor interactor and regulator LIM family [Helianthus annuus]KAJ0678867.1 putative transcription factor interactor and regulator LIM family [Helianthus annuus]
MAAMIQKNTNKITLMLIYAVLEWTLILLLLLNSLFSFLIIKFSQFFSLKTPCFWCSTLHRFFEPENVNLHRDLLCEFHSKEVSTLGFCPNHKKLAEIKDLCDECFSCHLDFQSNAKQNDDEHEHEQKLKCSCCGLKFNKHNVLESSRKRDLVEKQTCSNDEIGSALIGESPKIRINCFESETCVNKFDSRGDSTSDFLPQHLEFFFDYSGNQLVPIELVDSSTEESQNISEADQDFEDYDKDHVIQEHQTSGLESMELEETENSLVFHAKISEFVEKSVFVEETPACLVNTEELQESIETKKLDPKTHLVDEELEVSCVEEPSVMIENGLEMKNLSGIVSEIEEEKIPDTPVSVKKFFMFGRKESRGEESLDGSLMSEMEGGDPVNTTEKLKSALRVLKAELEEERSASAVAASETMAMITRLQEEKAAMQMEALQYQRMMEEQSEYDQEALQLLNELMIKKEKELEVYKKKVADYEAKERMQFSQGSLKNGTCSTSVSCSHSEDGNGMAIETTHKWNGNVPDSGVLELDTSLADFEEERLTIFEQIKALEEKLFALSDEEDQHFADVRPIEDLVEENGFHSDDMVTKSNGFHSNDTVTKSNGYHSNKLENEKTRMDLMDEVDQVYERLQALEADREFLKHCIGSLNKGEKGMELLQEILQHLRDLRTTDFQA